MRVFWALADQIPRIEAHQQRMQLQVATCSGTADGVKHLNEALDSQIGNVVSAPRVHPLAEKAEPGAFDRLRALA